MNHGKKIVLQRNVEVKHISISKWLHFLKDDCSISKPFKKTKNIKRNLWTRFSAAKGDDLKPKCFSFRWHQKQNLKYFVRWLELKKFTPTFQWNFPEKAPGSNPMKIQFCVAPEHRCEQSGFKRVTRIFKLMKLVEFGVDSCLGLQWTRKATLLFLEGYVQGTKLFSIEPCSHSWQD